MSSIALALYKAVASPCRGIHRVSDFLIRRLTSDKMHDARADHKKEAQWINDDGVGFREDTLKDLLAIYQSSAHGYLDGALKFMEIYLGIFTGLVVGTVVVGGFVNFGGKWWLAALVDIVIIAIMIFLSRFGWGQCKRLYRRHMMDLSQVMKIEEALGLSLPVKVKGDRSHVHFPDDTALIQYPVEGLPVDESSEKFVFGPSNVLKYMNLTFWAYVVLAGGLLLCFTLYKQVIH